MAIAGEVTDPAALHTEDLEVQSGAAQLKCYLARSREAGPRPGIIVLHEAYGLVEHIKDVCRRFAAIGYIAIAPDLYTRIGAPDPSDRESAMAKMQAVRDDQLVPDLEALAAHLRANESATGIGVIGFCFGGRETLLFASMSRTPDAAIDCWGGFIMRASPDNEITPQRPMPVIDLVEGVTCPIFVVGGEEDQNPSPGDLDALKRRLEAGGKDVAVKIYREAGHAFFADYRPTYREPAAFQLWDDIVDFFGKRLPR